MDTSWVIIILVLVGMGLPIFMGGIAMLLKHSEAMAKLSTAGGARDPKLLERIDALEKRCERLEAQSAETQLQLADEQRQLDKKLSGLLDDAK